MVNLSTKYKSLILLLFSFSVICAQNNNIEEKISKLISKMTVEEKIGQMSQRSGGDEFVDDVRKGKIGSLLNTIDVEQVNRIQRVAVEESRIGIPLIIGRDVIHGFQTIFPIPLGMACSFNPEMIENSARIAAIEAAADGVRWTFAPMVDITRDPRWGRIAETLGEDPYLTSQLSLAMINGFQTDDLSNPSAIAACAKHFVGYGAVEGGRDYNTTSIPESKLRDIFLKPFRASVDGKVATLMSAFNDVNGIPMSGNTYILKNILRDEWGFDGFVVSDYDAIQEMIVHGFAENDADAARIASMARIDMEMSSPTYNEHLKKLVEEEVFPLEVIDTAVANILRIKFRLGLFENPYTDIKSFPEPVNKKHLLQARLMSRQSIVLLKNENNILPLNKKSKSIAVIGPMADKPLNQLGCWSANCDSSETQTPLDAIKEFAGKKVKINFAEGMEFSLQKDTKGFFEAVKVAESSDLVLLILGEEAVLSGENHCRSKLTLPGAQDQLFESIKNTGKPIILVVMAGRPLAIGDVLNKSNAVLYQFHPGTMGGPALADILFGVESPSAKLPVTFPKSVGQIPIYYNHRNSGRPPIPGKWNNVESIQVRPMPKGLFKNQALYLDLGYEPLFPFGYGLTYTNFEYSDLKLSNSKIKNGKKFTVSALIKNTGKIKADEIVQLYVRDLVGSRTRPVRELKGFKRVTLEPGESKQVSFELNTNELGFYNQEMDYVTEPGKFHIWIAKDSQSGLKGEFEIIN